MKFITICRDTPEGTPEGEKGPYVLATRKVFSTRDAAEKHIRPISPSREPLVVEGDFDHLCLSEAPLEK